MANIRRVAHPYLFHCPVCSSFKEHTEITCCRDHPKVAPACDIRICRDCAEGAHTPVGVGTIESRFAEVLALVR